MSIFLVLHTAVTSPPERFGNLHGKGSNTTRRAVDQHLLPRLNVSIVAECLQGSHCRHGYGRSLLERKIGRFQRYCIFIGTYILRKCATTGCSTGQVPKDFITWLKLPDLTANRLDPPGYV